MSQLISTWGFLYVLSPSCQALNVHGWDAVLAIWSIWPSFQTSKLCKEVGWFLSCLCVQEAILIAETEPSVLHTMSSSISPKTVIQRIYYLIFLQFTLCELQMQQALQRRMWIMFPATTSKRNVLKNGTGQICPCLGSPPGSSCCCLYQWTLFPKSCLLKRCSYTSQW